MSLIASARANYATLSQRTLNPGLPLSLLPIRFDVIVQLHSIVGIHVDKVDTVADIREFSSQGAAQVIKELFMQPQCAILAVTIITVLSYVAAVPQGSPKPNRGEKREHTVYILDKGFSSNEQGFGALVLVLDALPGNTNIIRVVNKSSSSHGFQMEIENQKFGLENPVAPGKTAQFEFTAPPQLRGSTGTFYSPIGDDRKRGFEGRVTLLSEAEGG